MNIPPLSTWLAMGGQKKIEKFGVRESHFAIPFGVGVFSFGGVQRVRRCSKVPKFANEFVEIVEISPPKMANLIILSKSQWPEDPLFGPHPKRKLEKTQGKKSDTHRYFTIPSQMNTLSTRTKKCSFLFANFFFFGEISLLCVLFVGEDECTYRQKTQ